MRSITHRRLSPTALLAIVALFMSLGGTGYAAATLSGKNIKKRSIPANRVVPNALTGRQINEQRLGTVPAAELARTSESAVTAESAKTAQSAKTAETATTAENAKLLGGHAPSRFMVNQVRVVTADSPSITGPNVGTAVVASCDPSEKAIGGGAAWIIPGTDTPTALDLQLTASLPVPGTSGTDSMTGWQAAGRNMVAIARVLRAYATCVPKTA
jgi:hypothetical protein